MDPTEAATGAATDSAGHRLEELGVHDMIERLETTPDEFYVSVTPYLEQTHDCFFHSRTTCLGELRGGGDGRIGRFPSVAIG